jgi:transposase InsO family protein
LGITHRRTAYHHPEGNSYIERFHRSLEEEVGLAEYRDQEEARKNIERYLWEYNHDRPHRGLRDRTPQDDFVSLEKNPKNRPRVSNPGGGTTGFCP